MDLNLINKLKNNLDNPIIIVLIGHLIIFSLAIPYYYKFSIYSLLNMFFIIFVYILFFSLPFFLDNIFKNNNSIRNVVNIFNSLNNFYFYLISLFLVIFYGVYVVTNSIILSIFYPIIIILVLNLFSKCSILNYENSNNNNNNNNNNKNVSIYLILSKYLNEIIFSIGIISFLALLINYNTIPLFNYSVRMEISNNPLRLISTGALIYGGIGNIYYFIIAFIILTLIGYKAGILILAIAFLIYGYKTKKIPLKWILLSSILLLIFLAIMAKTILLNSGQNWKVGVLGILSYRAYFDMFVLEKIINYPNLMLGKIVFNPVGEKLIGEILLGYSHNITSTLFGPIYLDFGIFGVVFAFLLGVISKVIYSGNKKLYTIYCAILLSMCEIGINYGFIIVLFVLLYVNSLMDKLRIKSKNY